MLQAVRNLMYLRHLEKEEESLRQVLIEHVDSSNYPKIEKRVNSSLSYLQHKRNELSEAGEVASYEELAISLSKELTPVISNSGVLSLVTALENPLPVGRVLPAYNLIIVGDEVYSPETVDTFSTMAYSSSIHNPIISNGVGVVELKFGEQVLESLEVTLDNYPLYININSTGRVNHTVQIVGSLDFEFKKEYTLNANLVEANNYKNNISLHSDVIYYLCGPVENYSDMEEVNKKLNTLGYSDAGFSNIEEVVSDLDSKITKYKEDLSTKFTGKLSLAEAVLRPSTLFTK